jgi:hypothetical protein
VTSCGWQTHVGRQGGSSASLQAHHHHLQKCSSSSRRRDSTARHATAQHRMVGQAAAWHSKADGRGGVRQAAGQRHSVLACAGATAPHSNTTTMWGARRNPALDPHPSKLITTHRRRRCCCSCWVPGRQSRPSAGRGTGSVQRPRPDSNSGCCGPDAPHSPRPGSNPGCCVPAVVLGSRGSPACVSEKGACRAAHPSSYHHHHLQTQTDHHQPLQRLSHQRKVHEQQGSEGAGGCSWCCCCRLQ